MACKDEEDIRTRRDGSNAAIAGHDVQGLASFWTDDVNTTSSMGRQVCGKPANVAFYTEILTSRPDTFYLRTPTQVQVMSEWGVAMECGGWSGSWTGPGGRLQVKGRYMAQWRRIGALWHIHGELYVPTGFTGEVGGSGYPFAQDEP